MKRIFSFILVIPFFGFLSMFTVSCLKSTGGGWAEVGFDYPAYQPITTPGKATFGFNARCEDNVDGGGVIKVKLEYNDHYNKVKFHGVGKLEGDGISSMPRT